MTGLLFRRSQGLDIRQLPMPHRRLPAPLRWLLALLAALAMLAAALYLAARLLLAPQAGEWAMPVRLGPVELQVGVPSVVRLATAPWLGPRLDGRRLATRWGPVRVAWQAADHSLLVHCAPCTLAVPALGEAPVQVAGLSLAVRRDFNALAGTVRAVPRDTGRAPLEAAFTAQLQQDGMALRFSVPAASIADWYAVLVPELPDLRRASIAGTLALQARLQLPSGRFDVSPTVAGFEVHGLGTEAFAHAASACGKPSRLRGSDWLARAVIAAEDQRFYEHMGYDLRELTASLAANQQGAGVVRGASTLTQQLAKRLVTGDARTAERKLHELLVAVEMEHTLGKGRILQLYLDNAPWGPGLCGAEAAARHYFQRSARQLEPAQAVWLAAMLHNPVMEAKQWVDEGRINLARAQWVARNVRGVRNWQSHTREALLQDIAALSD